MTTTLGGQADVPFVTPCDEEVIRRVLAGESALFAVLMRRHERVLHRAIRSIVRDEAEVADVVQETYAAVYASLGQFAFASKPITWIARIGVNAALAAVRRRRPKVDHEVDELPTGAHHDPELGASVLELARIVEDAVLALPESYRFVFLLRRIEGLDTATTAACLELTEDTVKVRLHRATAMLRAELA